MNNYRMPRKKVCRFSFRQFLPVVGANLMFCNSRIFVLSPILQTFLLKNKFNISWNLFLCPSCDATDRRGNLSGLDDRDTDCLLTKVATSAPGKHHEQGRIQGEGAGAMAPPLEL